MQTSSLGTALITGASSGIGAVYADRFAKRGYDLILVARNRERLEALATRLAADAGRSVKVIVADLNDRAALARVEQVLRTDASITVLVNNAGIAMSGDLVSADPERLESMIQLNVLVPSLLALAVIPGFVVRGSGTCSGLRTVNLGLANTGMSGPAISANKTPLGLTLCANEPTLACKWLANIPVGQHAVRIGVMTGKSIADTSLHPLEMRSPS